MTWKRLMMRTTRLLLLLLICLPQIAFTKTLKVAIAASFTGPSSAFAAQMLNGASTAVDVYNEKKVLDSPLAVVTFDDACDPVKARKIAADIVRDPEIVAVVGHFCSSATLAAAEVYNKA